jgi:hypothetical protein
MADLSIESYLNMKDSIKYLSNTLIAIFIMVILSKFLLKVRRTLEGLKNGYEERLIMKIEKDD